MTKNLGYRVRRLFNDRPNPTFVGKPWHVLINWGNSNQPNGLTVKTINSYEAVRIASNKLITFQRLEGVDGIRIPNFTTDPNVATTWRVNGPVVARTVLSGHSGAGIRLLEQGSDWVQAPLYVQYVPKKKEFRVHVAFGQVIDVQEKRKRSDYDGDADYKVRNHHTGWVYCREDIAEPQGLREMAVATVARLGLDFGAVDLIYNEKRNEVYVLECNTAPGLEGTTVEKYARAFVEALK